MPTSLLRVLVKDESNQFLDQSIVSVYQRDILIDRKISSDGLPVIFVLNAQDSENSLDPFYPAPYESYEVYAQKEGFQTEIREDIRVFENIGSELEIVMVSDYA